MKIHLQKEIDHLKKQLFHLSSLVEENLRMAIRAVADGDAALAAKVKENDDEIDRIEVEVEEDCLKILALHQPVAVDLRFLIAALKMNNDLERIGDLAVNIAGVLSRMGTREGSGAFSGPFLEMGAMARTMLRQSLEALMDLDTAGARAVLKADDEVDDAYHKFAGILIEEMTSTPETGHTMVAWLMGAKAIERVADLATNIAEDTLYTVEGEIVRHGRG